MAPVDGGCPVAEGATRKEDMGYRYIPSANVSVQGHDAVGAWKATSHILKALHIPAKVVFVWYDNDKTSKSRHDRHVHDQLTVLGGHANQGAIWPAFLSTGLRF
jgi:hypothetical protein